MNSYWSFDALHGYNWRLNRTPLNMLATLA